MDKLRLKDIYIYGKHKSFPDYIKIYENRECIKTIESILSHSVFNKDSDESCSKFYIFSKKRGVFSGILSNSKDSKLRKAPFFICGFYKNQSIEKKWEKIVAASKPHLNYMEKIKSTDFNSFKEFKDSCNYLKKIDDINESSTIDKSDKIKNFILENIKKNSQKILKEKRLTFLIEKNINNDIMQILYNTRKITNQTPFSFIIKENRDSFLFTFFYKKFNANDLISIWQN